MRVTRFKAATAAAAAAALVLAACGDGDDDGEPGETEALPLVVGTTDTVTNIDPAGEFDQPSNNIVDSLYEKLLRIPPGGTEPEPELAEQCEFTDDVTYTCTLRDGLQFSDGTDLTVEDVVFSFERQVTIQHESGGWTLLNAINPEEGGSVEATDDRTVVFHLSEPDATFPFALTTPNAGSIVPSDVFPADDLQPNQQVVGSGPYVIGEFDVSQRITLDPNENYTGDREVRNSGVIIQIYQQQSALKQAIEEGEVMVGYRGLGVTDTVDLQDNGAERGVEVIFGQGTEINYMVLQASRPPFDDVAVRQAVAQVIDRDAIAESVYQGTVTPLYGPIPDGLWGHTASFQERYGEPDPAAAADILEEAGVDTPVAFDLWWMPDRYGEEIADMYGEIERQLEDSGLFDVTLESLSWEQYSTVFSDQSMDAFDLGWFPDFPDSSNYLAGFYISGSGNFLNAGYENPEVDGLIDEILTNPDQDAREAAAVEVSGLIAEDAPIIQLWQRDQVAYIREGVTGIEDTLDASFIFRFYLVGGVEE
jgi:peptide/nickel transport system substrate-binding protein